MNDGDEEPKTSFKEKHLVNIQMNNVYREFLEFLFIYHEKNNEKPTKKLSRKL